jgi:hypothetical protein
MPPPRVEGPDRVLEIVPRQNRVEAGVDGVELVVELDNDPPLERQARNDGREAGAEHGDVVRRRFLPQRLLPFLRILVRPRPVERDGVLIDLVVEICLEGAVRITRVPLLRDKFDLVGDWLLIYLGRKNLMLARCIVALSM